jgi:RimJ/RimL family protein N-acetyltransferase
MPDGSFPMAEQPCLAVGENWMLRPWRADDAAAVVTAFADPDVRRWNLHRIDDEREAVEWIGARHRWWADGTDAAWAVAPESGGAPVGFIALRQVRSVHARAELSGWAAPGVRRADLGTAVTEALAGWAFEAVGLHRLFLLHSTANPASCRLAMRAGFRREGTLRDYLMHTDGWHDMHLHARLSTDGR